MTYSQLGQDLRVVEFYNKKENGYFVEIGASDGITLSNTYLLETQYKWKGVCCEPVPTRYKRLIANRPNSHCIKEAVYNKSGLVLSFDIANKYDLLSGISQHIDRHRARVDENKTTINVQTITLVDLLNKVNAPQHIDYLSLDTEGTEYEILKCFDFNRYRFGLIDIEHNNIEPRRTDIKKLLTANGYIYDGQNKWDDMYRHSSVAPRTNADR
jgi:FkbM family methyltransferase